MQDTFLERLYLSVLQFVKIKIVIDDQGSRYDSYHSDKSEGYVRVITES